MKFWIQLLVFTIGMCSISVAMSQKSITTQLAVQVGPQNLQATPPAETLATATAIHPTTNEEQAGTEDTLASHIQQTYAKLVGMITDKTVPINAFFNGPATKHDFRPCQYNASVILPGAVEAKVSGDYRDWQQGTAIWYWECTLIHYPKDAEPAAKFELLKKRVDSIIHTLPVVKMTDGKNRLDSVSSWQNASADFNRTFQTYDQVNLVIAFRKPILQTQEAYIDSLVLLYRPGFNGTETAYNSIIGLASALTSGFFPPDKAENALAKEVKLVADKSIKRAYRMAFITYSLERGKLMNMMKYLTDAQKEELTAAFKAAMEERKNGRMLNPDTFIDNYESGVTYVEVNNAKPLVQNNQPQGEMVQCVVCDGTGQMDEETYSHIYSGISGTYFTGASKKVRCTFCNGTGRVLKSNKKRK